MGAVLVVLTLIQLGLGRRSERRERANEPRRAFLTRRRGGRGWHWTDIVTWVWLVGGLILMFGPALWLVASSFKTPAQLAEFPPTLLPYVAADGGGGGLRQAAAALPRHAARTARTRTLAEVRRVGIVAQMVDPAAPGRDRQGQHRRPHAGARRSVSPVELHRALPALRLPALPAQLGLRDGRRHAHHAAHQLHGRLRALQVRVPRPRRGDAPDRRHADGAALGDPRPALLGHLRRSACSTRSGASSCRRSPRRPASSSCASTC